MDFVDRQLFSVLIKHLSNEPLWLRQSHLLFTFTLNQNQYCHTVVVYTRLDLSRTAFRDRMELHNTIV